MTYRTKKIIAYLCCICLLIPLLMNNNTVLANTLKKKRIAVIDFENHTRLPQASAGISELFVVELVKTKKFEVLERQKLQQILKEQYRGGSGALTEESAAKLGGLLGVDYLVFGSIVSIEESGISVFGISQKKVKVTLTMKFVDATTGSIIFAEEASESVIKGGANISIVRDLGLDIGDLANLGEIRNDLGSDDAVAAAIKAVDKLVEKILEVDPLEGVISAISSDTVYINLGRDHGVKPGQIYEVFIEGKIITDPHTGKIIGVERIKQGELKITGVEAQMSIGKKKSGTISVKNKVRKIK